MTHLVGSQVSRSRRQVVALLAGIPVAAAAVFISPAANAAPLPAYAAVAVTPLPGYDTNSSFNINSAGIVAVTSRVSSTSLQVGSISTANGSLKLQPRPGDQHSTAVAVNERGDAIGASAATAIGTPRPVLYPAGNPTPTAVPSVPDDITTTLTGISGDLMVGYSRNAAGVNRPVLISNRPGEGFIATNLGLSAGVANAFPQAINSSGKIVGTAQTTNGLILAAEFKNAQPTVPLGVLAPGGAGSIATAMNEAGQVVGYGWRADNIQHAVVFANGVATPLGELAGDNRSFAFGIGNNGDVVGTSCNAANSCRAVLWSGGQALDLNSVVPVGFVLTTASGVNDAGQIATTGTVSGAPRAIILSAPHTTGMTTTAILSNLAKMTATVFTAEGKPVIFAPVAFKTGNRLLCVVLTDLSGTATCNQTLSALLSLGYQTVFPGNAIYAGSSATGRLL